LRWVNAIILNYIIIGQPATRQLSDKWGMNMQAQLQTKLEQLRAALKDADNLSDHDIKALQMLDDEIQTLLAGQSQSDLETKIEQQAVAFEGQYPQLSAILRDVMDTLSKMGI
jgi:hypothetical protein